ncbi:MULTISPECIES: hypothetical protein [unclassified Phyllobacterium]|uniref:hypothetical protein n=1 Tax=unclassified Phyllobacterium TaxID=2638441 RepID=UPI0031FC1668
MPINASLMITRLKSDLLQFAVLAVYLYVCLSAIILYKITIVGSSGDGFWPFGLPALKALLLAKFILLGHAVHLGDRYSDRRIINVIASKALLYLALLITLSILEEIVVGLIHGRTIAASLSDLLGKAPQIFATSFIMLLVLIPYLASREISSAFEGGLWRKLLEKRSGLQSRNASRGNT